MKISDKKKAEIYHAISSPIFSIRIFFESGAWTSDQPDKKLFNLETDIWRKVADVLGIQP